MTKIQSYQIVRIVAVEHPIYGGVCGSTIKPLSMSYRSLELARKLAGRLTDAEYNGCSDDYFKVVLYDSGMEAPYPAMPFDDMPF